MRRHTDTDALALADRLLGAPGVALIAILIALVTLVQFSGDRLVHWLRSR